METRKNHCSGCWRRRRRARAGAQHQAGRRASSGSAHVCFPFSCIIYFASARCLVARAGAPGQCLWPLLLAGRRKGRSEPGTPRRPGSCAAPPRRAGTREGTRAAGSGRLEGRLSLPSASASAASRPVPGSVPLLPPARGQAQPEPPRPAPRASAPCPGPGLSRPGGPAAQTFCSSVRRSSLGM